ncbi:DMT family transporter [Nonomuraea endophytica]|uniref:Drug/metabolite transporter (DMT)-like permease n=1 Tax=Nonomuraea endophytica TaxID=714136 RepID=A0A7W8A0Q4_9ACTN|nr:EamA family transporter [Nonomuraea endophytica]MBB5076700.1 drug/metabolite transporter (DMT)-like permease [Nonomuraea endophytica]
MTPISARRGVVYASIAAAAWGTGGAAGSLLFTTLDPVSVSFWRYLLGAAFLLPLLLHPTRTHPTRTHPTRTHPTPSRHLAPSRLPRLFSAASARSDHGGDRRTDTASNSRIARWWPRDGATRATDAELFGAASARRADASDRPTVTAGNRWVAKGSGGASSVGGRWSVRGVARVGVVGVGMAVYQAAYFAAIAESGIALATVVTMGATPVLTALGGRFLLNERLSRVGLVALAAALAGLALLTGGGTGEGTTTGVAWSLLSALGYAAVTLYSRRHNGDPEATAVGGFAVGAACLAPFPLAGGILPEFTLSTAATLLFLGAVPTALAYALFFRSLTALPATTVSVISLGEAVGAAMIGVVLFGERLTLPAWSGCVLLLAAVVVLTVHGQR